MPEISLFLVKAYGRHCVTDFSTVYSVYIDEIQIFRDILVVAINGNRCAAREDDFDSFCSELRLNERAEFSLCHFAD